LFRTSLQFGITCLKRVNFDRSQLEERRRIAEHETIDILVWSNERVIKWITSIGLKVCIFLFSLIIHLLILQTIHKKSHK
jgi:hypothetical protein